MELCCKETSSDQPLKFFRCPHSEYIDVPEWVIIHEVYEGENSHEAFESDLDRALEAGPAAIIVEPRRLGEETARWIALGNCLHQTAVLTGVGSLATTLLLSPPSTAASSHTLLLVVAAPLAAAGALCATLYSVSWATDPCVGYQIEKDQSVLDRLPLSELANPNPLVLVRKNDRRRRVVHLTTTGLAVGMVVWRLYRAWQHGDISAYS